MYPRFLFLVCKYDYMLVLIEQLAFLGISDNATEETFAQEGVLFTRLIILIIDPTVTHSPIDH